MSCHRPLHVPILKNRAFCTLSQAAAPVQRHGPFARPPRGRVAASALATETTDDLAASLAACRLGSTAAAASATAKAAAPQGTAARRVSPVGHRALAMASPKGVAPVAALRQRASGAASATALCAITGGASEAVADRPTTAMGAGAAVWGALGVAYILFSPIKVRMR